LIHQRGYWRAVVAEVGSMIAQFRQFGKASPLPNTAADCITP